MGNFCGGIDITRKCVTVESGCSQRVTEITTDRGKQGLPGPPGYALPLAENSLFGNPTDSSAAPQAISFPSVRNLLQTPTFDEMSDAIEESVGNAVRSLANIAFTGSASDLTYGTIPVDRLPSQVARRDQLNTFTQPQAFSVNPSFPLSSIDVVSSPASSAPFTRGARVGLGFRDSSGVLKGGSYVDNSGLYCWEAFGSGVMRTYGGPLYVVSSNNLELWAGGTTRFRNLLDSDFSDIAAKSASFTGIVSIGSGTTEYQLNAPSQNIFDIRYGAQTHRISGGQFYNTYNNESIPRWGLLTNKPVFGGGIYGLYFGLTNNFRQVGMGGNSNGMEFVYGDDGTPAPIKAGAATFSGDVTLTTNSSTVFIPGPYGNLRLRDGDVQVLLGANRTALFGQNGNGAKLHSSYKISFSPSNDVFSGSDTAYGRNATGQAGIYADNGLVVRNYAGTDFAAIVAKGATFNETVDLSGSSNLLRFIGASGGTAHGYVYRGGVTNNIEVVSLTAGIKLVTGGADRLTIDATGTTTFSADSSIPGKRIAAELPSGFSGTTSGTVLSFYYGTSVKGGSIWTSNDSNFNVGVNEGNRWIMSTGGSRFVSNGNISLSFDASGNAAFNGRLTMASGTTGIRFTGSGTSVDITCNAFGDILNLPSSTNAQTLSVFQRVSMRSGGAFIRFNASNGFQYTDNGADSEFGTIDTGVFRDGANGIKVTDGTFAGSLKGISVSSLVANGVRVAGNTGVEYSGATPASTVAWRHWTANNPTYLFLKDEVNGRDQITHTRGASAGAAITQFHSRVIVDHRLDVASDSDLETTIGRGKLYSGPSVTDCFTLSHIDHGNNTNYMLRGFSNGSTRLNAALGQEATIALNDVVIARAVNNNFVVQTNLQLGGTSGPALKNESGTISARNAADSAYASMLVQVLSTMGTVNVGAIDNTLGRATISGSPALVIGSNLLQFTPNGPHMRGASGNVIEFKDGTNSNYTPIATGAVTVSGASSEFKAVDRSNSSVSWAMYVDSNQLIFGSAGYTIGKFRGFGFMPGANATYSLGQLSEAWSQLSLQRTEFDVDSTATLRMRNQSTNPGNAIAIDVVNFGVASNFRVTYNGNLTSSGNINLSSGGAGQKIRFDAGTHNSELRKVAYGFTFDDNYGNYYFYAGGSSGDGLSRGKIYAGMYYLDADVRWTRPSAQSMALQAYDSSLLAWQDIVRAEANSAGARIGFFGATPIGRPTLPADAVDLPSALALLNSIRAQQIALGLAA